MLTSTGTYVDAWWANLMGVAPEQLWRSVTASRHTLLGDYTGWFVSWRASGAHVSAPATASRDLLDELAATDREDVSTEVFWSDFAARVGGELVGPATHHYLDVDPGPDPGVVAVEVATAATLRDLVTPGEWWESGFADEDVTHAFAVAEDSHVVAASSLSTWAGEPRDVCVLVAPNARGRRLVDRVGRGAASYAIREHGLARWVARDDNTASMQAAARLGFEPWCHQLAVRAS